MPVLKPTESFQWYDAAGRAAGRAAGLTSRQVAAIVKKHNLRKRRIYGCMAVNVSDWKDYLERKAQNGVEASN